MSDMEQSFNEKVFVALASPLKSGKASWSDMKDAVNAAEIKIVKGSSKEPGKNWLDVRGIVQFMLNEKLIVRTKDTSNEEWKVINAAALQDWLDDMQEAD